MFKLLKKIFGTAQGRTINKYRKTVLQINTIEQDYQKLTGDELFQKTEEFKERLKKGESLESLLPEAYATVKNTCRRMVGTENHVSGYNQKWDMIPYDVQLIGAIAMFYGTIAEMQTGEGKTLTAAMPLYLHALTGKSTHLVTVNDYLAKRDCEWIGAIFKKMGLTVAALTNDVELSQRKDIYASDIVYGTASEFGFDYLRDNSMASNREEQVQRKPFFAIVDEIDSILIDEARTPLIISGPAAESKQLYGELKDKVTKIVRLQRDLCNHLASEAKKELDNLGISKEADGIKIPKEAESAFKKLWLISKGTPKNKILKRIKENPDLRVQIEKWETYFYSEQNKEEKAKALSDLYIIVDERASEYELTDKGMQSWSEDNQNADDKGDFVLVDLGYEFSKVDQDTALSSKEKIEKKTKLQEADSKSKERAHNLRQLFRAHLLMEKDVDYIVVNNKIIIIDENTGRPQPGRRFSDGLHQAIEAKESCPIQRETQTYATVTLQNYFRMYDKLAGMTGTAITEAGEFKEIYKLVVLEIPTYCNCQRVDHDDKVYMTEREKYAAILKEINQLHQIGRPILIGTESVEISEKLSRILKQNRLSHTILNAKNHSKEADIISAAGQKSSITLSTNMAGRGTDIKLTPEVRTLGGLHVIGTTRHHSRRIDRQLRGRSGRLGDPGSSQFFVSFEDSLMRLFASPRLTSMLQRFRPPEGEPISASVLSKSIETAQKRIEQRNYQIRKHTLEYDDVMNKQRQEIYAFRNDLIQSDKTMEIAEDIIKEACSIMVHQFFPQTKEKLWNIKGYLKWLMEHFPVTFEEKLFENKAANEVEKISAEKVLGAFQDKLQAQKELILKMNPQETNTDNLLNEVVRSLLTRKIDQLWQEHLLAIDHLRNDVNLRAHGQKDPLIEFKQEAFQLFANLSQRLALEMSKDLFRFEMISSEQKRRLEDALKEMRMTKDESLSLEADDKKTDPEEKQQKTITASPKTGRNETCSCGSGKKFKKCCGKTQTVPELG